MDIINQKYSICHETKRTQLGHNVPPWNLAMQSYLHLVNSWLDVLRIQNVARRIQPHDIDIVQVTHDPSWCNKGTLALNITSSRLGHESFGLVIETCSRQKSGPSWILLPWYVEA